MPTMFSHTRPENSQFSFEKNTAQSLYLPKDLINWPFLCVKLALTINITMYQRQLLSLTANKRWEQNVISLTAL